MCCFKRLSVFVLLIFLVASVGSASAESLTVLNHSFEEPDLGDEWGQTGAADGWSGVGSWFGMINRANASYGNRISENPDGTMQAAVSNSSSGFFQYLSETLKANTTYTLAVDIGCPSDQVFDGAVIDLGSGSGWGSHLQAATTQSLVAPIPGEWSTWTKTYVTGATPEGLGEVLRIEMQSTPSVQIIFDNVRLSEVTVPEPNTFVVMFSMAVIGLVGLRRSRRN